MNRLLVIVGLSVALLGAAPALAADAPASAFLGPDDLDPVMVLPAPPADDSPLTMNELAELHILQATRSPERLALAKRDADNETATAIASVLGPGFDLKALPATAKLFADLRKEDHAAAKRAKNHFLRTRPWAVDPSLESCDREDAVKSSYPSGHTTMGYAAADVLVRLVPSKAAAIQARAADYGESRLVCGVHYRRDIEAGHVLATALVDALKRKPAFQAEVDAARRELVAAHIAPERRTGPIARLIIGNRAFTGWEGGAD